VKYCRPTLTDCLRTSAAYRAPGDKVMLTAPEGLGPAKQTPVGRGYRRGKGLEG
jgi:hypothetical protein